MESSGLKGSWREDLAILLALDKETPEVTFSLDVKGFRAEHV